MVPEEGALKGNAIWFELEELAQNMETLYKLRMTFSGKHQQQHQHLEEALEGIPHDRIPAQDPTEKIMLSHLTNSIT